MGPTEEKTQRERDGRRAREKEVKRERERETGPWTQVVGPAGKNTQRETAGARKIILLFFST